VIGADGVVVSPGDLWATWSWDPAVLGALVGAAALYGVGLRRLLAAPRRSRAWTRRAAAFYAGLMALGIALVSPLDGLGHTLFSAHMVQHLVLILGAPPLLAYGRPAFMWMIGLPPGWRRAAVGAVRIRPARPAGRVLTHPLAAGALHAVAMWAWHLPALYLAALTSDWVHALEHISFLATALVLWTIVVGHVRGRAGYGGRLALVFGTALQSSALGAILTFAGAGLYPVHAPGAAAWGLSLLEDQQLAGAIMWIPAGVVYLLAMVVLFVRWLSDVERRTEAGDRARTAAPAVWEPRG
jgi:putative membrane protein